MKLLLIANVDRLDGVTTTFADAAVELRVRGVDVDLYILTDNVRPVREAMDEYIPKHNARVLPWTVTLARQLLVSDNCPALTTATIAVNVLKDIPRRCVGVLYPQLYEQRDGWTVEDLRVVLSKNCDIMIGNNANGRLLNMDDVFMYWGVGFARSRINALRHRTVISSSLTAAEYARTHVQRETMPTAFDYGVYKYSRSMRGGGTWWENIGKLPFEFLLTGRRVLYSAAGKQVDDGLTELLREFGVDDNVDQELMIPVAALEQRFFDKPYDELLKIVNRLAIS